MQKVDFPPIRGGFQISTIPAGQNPSRSWSRYKKLLIDNPKDANLLQRQKLWNFQKLNRGAFRSQITSLPDIPYRVKPSPIERVSIGIQTNLPSRYSRGQRVIFPNLTPRRSYDFASNDYSEGEEDILNIERIAACSPMPDVDIGDYDDDFEDDSSIDDVELEFETVVTKKNAGTMTMPAKNGRRKEKRKRGSREREKAAVKKDKPSILVNPTDTLRAMSPKAVSFMLDDGRGTATAEDSTVPKVNGNNINSIVREASMHSLTSGGSYLNMPVENVGHTSQLSTDPLSVLDFLSGSRTDRSSKMADISPRKTPAADKPKRRTKGTDPEADRVWFEKIVGDKDVVDVGTYENFARTRPNTDNNNQSQSDSATADRIVDFSRVYARKNYTPRINDDFHQYHSVVGKDPGNSSKNKVPPPTINKGRGARRGVIGVGKN